jgi:hypothetical protein
MTEITYVLRLTAHARKYRREGSPHDSWELLADGRNVHLFWAGDADTAIGGASDALASHGITAGVWVPSPDGTERAMEGGLPDPVTFRVTGYQRDSASPMEDGIRNCVEQLREWGHADATLDEETWTVTAGGRRYALGGQQISGDVSGGVHYTWTPELVTD